MSTATTILRRMWGRLRNPSYFVGKDLEGNKYFEYPNPNDGFGRAKRVVKYRRGYDMWTYIAGDKRLPVQWSSWLSHTRAQPPTLQELQSDLMRQERIRLRVAMLEAADRNATADLSTAVYPDCLPITHATPHNKNTAVPGDLVRRRPSPDAFPNIQAASTVASPVPKDAPVSDQPESWAPQVARRSG